MSDYNLTADGYGMTSALNARTAADAIRQREFDLALLDINLPDGNGFEMCKLIKPQHPDTIVIFLTANDQESDQIRGYEAGAVDYITKPFVIGALQRKIKAMFAMLEHHKPAKDIYDDGRLFLDFPEQTASLNGKPLTLSPMEYKMLNLFRKNPRQVLTRGQLLEKLWDIDERFVDEHTLTTSISRIRSKIEADGGAPYIKTVYGMGVNCDNRFPNACVSTKIPTRAHKQRRPARQQHRNLFCHKKQGYGDPGHGKDKSYCHQAKQPLYR